MSLVSEDIAPKSMFFDYDIKITNYLDGYKDLEFDILEPLYELIDTVENLSLGTFTRDEILDQYSIDDTYFNKLVHGLHLLDRYIEVRRVQ